MRGVSFAVVAAEVRALSPLPSRAASEIKALIDALALNFRTGVLLVTLADHALDEIPLSIWDTVRLPLKSRHRQPTIPWPDSSAQN